MRRPPFVFLVSLLAVSLVACGRGDGSTSPEGSTYDRAHRHRAGAPPNVIFIVLDTARADRVSLDGYWRLTTPHLDAFARDAVFYRDAHSVSPWTLPSHMSMFTGLLPGQHGANWLAFATPDDIDLREILARTFEVGVPSLVLPQRLREAGYSTAGFSSNAWISRRTGFDAGFDQFYEMWKERDHLRKGYRGLDRRIRTDPPFDKADAGMVLMRFKQHVLEREGTLQEPFFAFFNFIDPHYPYSPPELWRYRFSGNFELGERIAKIEFDEMSMQAGAQPVDPTRFSPFYDAEMSYLDFAVGRLLDWFRERDYYDESLIVITSDHGEHLGEQGRFSHQLSMEEELLRIPLLIKYPSNVGGGRVVQDPLVSNLDVYETILAAAAAAGRSAEGPRTVSFDLSDMDAFERPFLVSEYYHSVPYLRLNRDRYEGFPLEEHSATRRVLYSRQARYVFEQRDGVSRLVSVAGNADPVERRQVEAFLAAYLEGLNGGVLQDTEQPLDPETLERLRTLGYVN